MNEKIRILYMDDDGFDRELVKGILKREQRAFEVFEAANKKAFESLIINSKFDIVLSDLNIDGFEGLQVLKTVQNIDPGIPVIIVTATGSEEVAVEALKQGASDYVIKRPEHIQNLPQTIVSAIEKKELRNKRRVADKSLKDSEAKYHGLISKMNAGFALHEVIYDDNDRPCDYKLLEVNPKFEQITGLKSKNIIGKTVLEVLPGTEPYWIKTYGDVVITREPIVFENYSSEMGKYFSVFAYPSGKNQFATIVTDITETKISKDLTAAQLELSTSLNLIDNIKDGLSLCMDAALRVSDMDFGGIYLLDENLTELELIVHKGLSEDFVKNVSTYQRESKSFEFAMAGKPLYTERLKIGLPLSGTVFDENLRAIAIVPIKHRNQILGCLNVSSGNKEKIPESSRICLEAISNQIGAWITYLKTQKSLQLSEERFELAMAASRDGIYDWNLVTNEVYYSPGWKRMLGYAYDELPNDFAVWEKLTMAQDVKRSWEMVNEVIQKKRDRFEMEFKMKHNDGHWIDILSRAKAVFNEDGEAVRIVGTHIDITELKRYERETTLQKEKIETYLNLAGVIFVALNTKGEVTLINQKGCDILGYAHEEIVGKNWFENFIPEWLRDDLIPISKQLLNGDIEPVEYYENPILTKEGEERLVAWHNTVLKDSKGNITGHLSAGDDVTDKRHMAEQLRQSQKMESIGNLAGGIAHDFNNILASILGFTELALDDVAKGSPIEDSLQEVYTAGKRARDLVKQILVFARRSDEERKPLQVDNIAKEVMKLIRSTIPTTIRIKHDIQSRSLIMGNSSQIHQLLMNLCTNAAQAMEDTGGILEIGLADVELSAQSAPPLSELKSGKYIKIVVADTGPGISPDIIGSIFEPYFTIKGVGEGTGMGLALVHGIVESYGGKITVESDFGKGAVFSVYLPITKKSEEHLRYEEERLPSGTEHILIVDDEPTIAKMACQILGRLGYQVTPCTGSVEALKLFRSKPHEFDLVITDMTMPDMTGDKLAMEIMASRPEIPVILCTGYSKKISDSTADNMGIRAFSYKPVVKADLAKTVRKVLDEAKNIVRV